MKSWYFFFVALAIVVSASIVSFYWHSKLPLVSPLDFIENLPVLSPIFRNQTRRAVIGFLPYWNLDEVNETNLRSLTHLAYFGVGLDANGKIEEYLNPGEKEPGFRVLNSEKLEQILVQTRILGIKNLLTVRVMDADIIDAVLNNVSARQEAVKNLVDLTAKHNYQGINLDFEHPGFPSQETIDNYTLFVQEISRECKKNIQNCEMSLDVYADSANKKRLFDISRVGNVVDLLIIMTYDFHRPSSTIAGPVSPLRGRCTEQEKQTLKSCLEYDVITSVADITKLVPSSKTILGIPFYGYQWQTSTSDYLSRTYPKTGNTVTYQNIKELFFNPNLKDLKVVWSESSQTPYLTFTKGDFTYQLHYDNPESLGLKLELVKDANLAGIAIWAIGYENPYTDLWQTINKSL